MENSFSRSQAVAATQTVEFCPQFAANRTVALLLLVAGITFPALAATSVTGDQLEQILVAAHGKRDAKVAKQLLGLELTERLSTTRFSSFREDLPGSKTRQALMALADMSAFLDLPATEIPVIAKPDPEAQHEMISLMMNYVKTTIHQLPNFFANSPYHVVFSAICRQETLLSHPNGRHSAIVLLPRRRGKVEFHWVRIQSAEADHIGRIWTYLDDGSARCCAR